MALAEPSQKAIISVPKLGTVIVMLKLETELLKKIYQKTLIPILLPTIKAIQTSSRTDIYCKIGKSWTGTL